MASLKIRLVETSGGPQITVDYEGDPGDLPFEHERDHRRAVAQLLGLTEAEMEAQGIVVSRDPVGAVGSDARGDEASRAPTKETSRGG